MARKKKNSKEEYIGEVHPFFIKKGSKNTKILIDTGKATYKNKTTHQIRKQLAEKHAVDIENVFSV